MFELLTDPAVWVSFATLTVLEIVLGVDNVVFIAVAANRLPPAERPRARMIGLAGALVLRIALLVSISWMISLSRPVVTILGFDASWRDFILLAGGLFLLAKATTEIYRDLEEAATPGGAGHENRGPKLPAPGVLAVAVQIMLLDLVFSVDSVVTAVGIADHLEVMIAAIVVAVGVMAVSARPVADFVERRPSTRMLALAFLLMIGMALMADGLHTHIDRGFLYAAMIFAGSVEGLNLLRARLAARRSAAG